MCKKYFVVFCGVGLIALVALFSGLFVSSFLLPQAQAAPVTLTSSAGSIAAFAYDWYWSKGYNQDGKYGETKVQFSEALPGTISSAKLTVVGSYSQMAGTARADVYIKTSQQVTPKDDAHNKGTKWYGDVADLGTKLGTYTTTYSGATQEFDVTSFISANKATTYYVAVENLATADIGISKIQITIIGATGETVILLADGESCSTGSECQGGYCVHNKCRSSSTYCGDTYCDSAENCTACSSDCGACLKADGFSCSAASECQGGYCVHNKCRSSSTYCGDTYCDSTESCLDCPADCGVCSSPKKANGEPCSTGSECESGYCVHSYCRVSSTHCADGYCDSGESCSSCSSDCCLCASKSGGIFKSSSCSIAAFAYDWWWSKPYNQDGRYGEVKIEFSESLPTNIASAKLIVAGSYSQQYGTAQAEVYMSTSQQITAKDSAHNKGAKWYGDVAVLGTKSGTFSLNYSGGTEEFDVTSYISSNRSTVYYVAVKNLATADIGISKIYLEVTEGEPKKADGSACSAGSECQGGYCVHDVCRTAAAHCGDTYCDSAENCSACSLDCGACQAAKKADGASCGQNSECQGGYCVHSTCRSAAAYCGDSYCDKGENCTGCAQDCACRAKECCSSGSVNANIRGCVTPGSSTKKGYICCESSEFLGGCCFDSQCLSEEECIRYKCVKKSAPGLAPEIVPESAEPQAEPAPPEPKVSEPKPQNLPDGSGCDSAAQCKGGFCVEGVCRSVLCGDKKCNEDENCSTCPDDCQCQQQKCCSLSSKRADARGCVVSNQMTTAGRICCEGGDYFGECCSDLDCPGYDKLCVQHRCVAKSVCGNGYCETGKGENCLTCSADCACYNSEVCGTGLARSDAFGCLKAKILQTQDRAKIKYIWCESVRQSGQCCSDDDCLSGEQCKGFLCMAKAVCGDWLCQTDKGENCKNCPDDCQCASKECCEPGFATNAQGCVGPLNKITERFICCDGTRYYGECCSNSQCASGQECLKNWCSVKPKCGDGKCDYNRGENCQTCFEDCRCYGSDCCSPASEKADIWGCIANGNMADVDRVCCNSQLKPGACCSNWDCEQGKECINSACQIPQAKCGDGKCETDEGENCACSDCACYGAACCSPSSSNGDAKGCVAGGVSPITGEICCLAKIHSGNCCSDSDCGAGEQCSAFHCTKFLEAFLRYYYEKEVGYGGAWSRTSDAYKGIAQFYRDQATQIDIPIIAFGQFVKVLDAMSDATRSVVGADIIGLGIALNNLNNQMGDWYLSDPSKLQNTLLLSYSAGTLLLEASGRSGTLFQDVAIRGLHQALPNNTLLNTVSQRHQMFRQRLGFDKAPSSQLFALNIADLAMDVTLLKKVDDSLKYDVLDYAQKIQLSMMAGRLSQLYQKAESGALTEDEAFALIMLERDFWVAAIGRCLNTIKFKEMEKQEWGASLWQALGANYDLVIESETAIKQTAESWLKSVEERRNLLFKEYFGLKEQQEKTVEKVSRFRGFINLFSPENLFKGR